MAVNRYDGSRAWYAISTYSGYEDKVADSIKQRIGSADLANKIFDALVPKEKQIEIKNGKRKAAVNMVLDFIKRLFVYGIAIIIGVGFQALLDSRYAFLSLFITLPVLIILIFSWYIGLEQQVKYINKYTQSITQALVLG